MTELNDILNYEKAIELINNNKNILLPTFYCSEKTIKIAETMLSLKLPRAYIMMLKTFGMLRFGGTDIEGICFNDVGKSGMLRLTLDSRNNNGMPKNFVVIEDSGLDGEVYCLQINEENPDKSPVVVYVHPDVPIEILAPDFGTYLLQSVEHEIKYQIELKESIQL